MANPCVRQRASHALPGPEAGKFRLGSGGIAIMLRRFSPHQAAPGSNNDDGE
jgi:hypothetical protein